MANEATQLPQPDTVPSAVSTGYTRQNTNAEAARNGDDLTSVIVASTTQVTLEAGGTIDVNGVLYTISTDTTLSIPAVNIDYWIYLAAGTGTDLTPTLTTSRGTFDATKHGWYLSGERVLDWRIRRGAANASVSRELAKNGEDVYAEKYRIGDSAFESQLSSLYNNTVTGTTIVSKAGSTSDFTLTGPTGNSVIEVPTGTVTTKHLGKTIFGAGTFATGVPSAYTDATNGLTFIGSTGSARDMLFAAANGASAFGIPTGTTSTELFGALLPTTTPTSGSQSIGTSGSSVVLTRGVWTVANLGVGKVQINVSGSWRDVAAAGNGCCIFSDGTNVQVLNPVGSGVGVLYYYQKY